MKLIECGTNFLIQNKTRPSTGWLPPERMSSMSSRALFSLLASTLALFIGCGGDPPATLGDGGVGPDADADTDSDADSDSDTDSETDTDEPQPETWTVMMYEDADNNLEDVLLIDINEAEAADLPDNVNFIVLVDRAEGYSTTDGDWTGAKLFRLQHDTDMSAINSERLADPEFLGLTDDSSNGEELDMGSGETLEKFIDYCQSAFPAEGYILHISDHGDGWTKKGDQPIPDKTPLTKGMCSDDSSGNAISISHDLGPALEGKNINSFSFDACLMGSVEVAWAIKDHVDYMAASVMSVPGDGWEYTSTFNNWFEDMTVRRWGDASVEEFENFYQGTTQVGFSSYDLRSMDDFGEALEAFLEAAEEADIDALMQAKDAAIKPQWGGWDGMIDFVDFITKCGPVVGEQEVQDLLDAFEQMMLSSWYSDDLEIGPMSIYAPSSLWGFGGYDPAYDETPLAQDTGWEDFIQPLVGE